MLGKLRDYLLPSGLTLVTAGDEKDIGCLLDFLSSAQEFEPNTPVVVFDLGLSDKSRREINARFRCEIRSPEFPHLHRDAVKPLLIHDVAQGSSGVVCWMEPTTILTERLSKVRDWAERDGVYPAICNVDAAQCVAFDMSSAEATNLLFNWAENSINRRRQA
jgi:hypothetical protein